MTDRESLACKNNALRQGLCSLQTVVPGEDPVDRDARRDAVLSDLRHAGAVETALAEQVAEKLWRLGRVVRHEADLIANAQAEDGVRHAHARANNRVVLGERDRMDVPDRNDVEAAGSAIEAAEKVVTERQEAVEHLEALPATADDDSFTSWRLDETILGDRLLSDAPLDKLLRDEDDDGPLKDRRARKILARIGDVEKSRPV